MIMKKNHQLELELEKNPTARVEELKAEFQTHEKGLVDKYGVNSVINLETGEVKEKEEEVKEKE